MSLKPIVLASIFSALTLMSLSAKANHLLASRFSIVQELKNCFHGGCDPGVQLNQSLEEKSRKVSEGLAGPARAEFESAMETVFSKHISTVLNQIDAISADRIRMSGDTLEKIIESAALGLEGIIDRSSVIASKFEPSQIKQQIILAASSEVKDISALFFAQVNQAMDRFDLSVEKADCTAQGYVEELRNDMRKFLESLSPQVLIDQSICKKQEGIPLLKPGFSLTNSEIYRLNKCSVENQVNSDTTVNAILGYYTDLQGFARRMRCVERNSNTASDYYTREYVRFGEIYDVWKRL